MSVWALGDLHLSFGVPDKKMDIFGDNWKEHHQKIKEHWMDLIRPTDLVLLPGDISWAMRTEDAKPDLLWIDALPGTKVMIRGNHDFWWNSLKKVEEILPPSIHVIQNNVFIWNDFAICGARLWDTNEYGFSSFITYKDNPKAKPLTETDENHEEAQRIFDRELSRLELSLKALPKDQRIRIAMTHYPPIGADLGASKTSQLLEKYQIAACVFGHLHNVHRGALPFGTKGGIRYMLTSCDYLDFTPLQVV